MKVSELIEQLKSYEGNKELLIAYWDKEFVETSFDSDESVKITDELWAEAISKTEKIDFWQDCGSEEICSQVRQLLEREQNG
jgi:hypothetical protein